MEVFSYSQGSEKSCKNFGGKNNGNLWLFNNGFNIPRGAIITSLDHDKNYSSVDFESLSKLLSKKGPWILRSSYDVEDGKSGSFAGLFVSKKMHNFLDIGVLIKEVLERSKSEFLDEYCNRLGIRGGGKMHILIQDYIDGEISGVFFSDMFNKGAILEYVEGTCDLLVDGKINAERIWYNQYKKNSDILNKVFDICFQIHSSYNDHVDIEWTVKKGIIYILQVRPIVT